MFNTRIPNRIELITAALSVLPSVILASVDGLSHPLLFFFPFPLTSCSNIGKTDQNPPLVVSQSRQRPQGIPQQGKKGSDRPGSILNSIGSRWPLRMTLLWSQLDSSAVSHFLAFFFCVSMWLFFHLSWQILTFSTFSCLLS